MDDPGCPGGGGPGGFDYGWGGHRIGWDDFGPTSELIAAGLARHDSIVATGYDPGRGVYLGSITSTFENDYVKVTTTIKGVPDALLPTGLNGMQFWYEPGANVPIFAAAANNGTLPNGDVPIYGLMGHGADILAAAGQQASHDLGCAGMGWAVQGGSVAASGAVLSTGTKLGGATSGLQAHPWRPQLREP